MADNGVQDEKLDKILRLYQGAFNNGVCSTRYKSGYYHRFQFVFRGEMHGDKIKIEVKYIPEPQAPPDPGWHKIEFLIDSDKILGDECIREHDLFYEYVRPKMIDYRTMSGCDYEI